MAETAPPAPTSLPATRRLPIDWQLAGFDSVPRTRLVFGNGAIGRVGELTADLGARRALLVTDAGIVRAGHAAKVRELLLTRLESVEVFDAVRENPDTECVDACLQLARRCRPEVIIGLGGGSSMDTAKGGNFLLTNGGRMQDYWGVGKAKLPMLPFIAIPTTAGTGSECQSAALIADATTHMKMACLDAKAAARVAILDPELTLSQPPRVTACTGIDAIAHAVETAVTTKRTALSQLYSREAFRLLAPSLPRVIADPRDVESRGRMLLGSALAGTAIELSMLGAAHSAANPLTAHFGIVHGIAVGLMLPHVVRFNAGDPVVAAAYAALVSGLDSPVDAAADARAVAGLIERLDTLLDVAGFPTSLAEAGAKVEAISTLADEAARQWTAGFNPRPIQAEDFAKLYRAAFQPRA